MAKYGMQQGHDITYYMQFPQVGQTNIDCFPLYRVLYKTQQTISACKLNRKRNVFLVLTSAVEIDMDHHTCSGCCFNRTMPNLH